MQQLQNLNGTWQVHPGDVGTLGKAIDVPGTAGGVLPEWFDPVWYVLQFEARLACPPRGRVYLEFDRVHLRAEVWLNEVLLGIHQHAEEPFAFDVTEILQSQNTLMVRVSAPSAGHEPVDGMTLTETPNGGQALAYYTFVSDMGITGKVRLRSVSGVHVHSVFLLPNPHTGEVEAQIELVNMDTEEHRCTVSINILEHRSCKTCTTHVLAIIVPSRSSSSHSVTVRVDAPQLWSPDNPFLYDAHISLGTPIGSDTWHGRFGFRELLVKNGFFHLNGKRIFLRCAHVDAFVDTPLDIIAAAKASGFTMLRFLSRMPSKEILDYTDETGMMVYEECLTSWGMSDYPNMEHDFKSYNDNMILRDRNHASVLVWGLFNEQPGANPNHKHPILPETSKVFDVGVAYLQRLRELDTTRLVLLSSGRWDARSDIGSYSNPGSFEWEPGWGMEGSEIHSSSDHRIMPYIPGMGDNHIYPTVPLDIFTRQFLRSVGAGGKPVLISELGYGCQTNIVRKERELLSRFPQQHPHILKYRHELDQLRVFLEKYGLRDLYAFEEDFLMASIEKNAMQRKLTFDLLRANPSLCGYSMTSFSIGHEGVFYASGLPIPNMFSTLKECWFPLRWSLFVQDFCLYAHQPIHLEAVLCNEDILPPGEYQARFAVVGPHGIAWEAVITFHLPENGPFGLPPLAFDVLDVTIEGLKPGAYTFAAELLNGAMPSGGRVAFTVAEAGSVHQRINHVATWALPENVAAFLAQHYLHLVDFREEASTIILVGLPDLAEKKQENWDLLFRQVALGATVIFLHPFAYDASTQDEFSGFMNVVSRKSDSSSHTAFLPFAPNGRRTNHRNWLYHVDNYSTGSDALVGVAGRGIVDYEQLGMLYPEYILMDMPAPDNTMCASFGCDLIVEDGTLSGLTLGEYTYGNGRIVLNTFRICESVGQHPLADRLLINLLNLYCGHHS